MIGRKSKIATVSTWWCSRRGLGGIVGGLGGIVGGIGGIVGGIGAVRRTRHDHLIILNLQI
jgi:hypothetical protein